MSYTFAGQFGPEAILSAGGTLQPSRSVTVYKSDGVTVATLYTDRTKGTTTANPTTSDVRGNLAVYADPGNYVLDYGGGSLFKILIPVDPAELSAAYVPAGAPASTGGDDTAALNAVLNTQKIVTLRPGQTYNVSTLLVPSATTLVIPTGTSVNQLAGTAGPIITNKTPGSDTYVKIVNDGAVTSFSNQTNNAGGIILEGAAFSTIEGHGYVSYTNGYATQIKGHGNAASGDAMYGTIRDIWALNLVSGVGHGLTCSASGSHPDGSALIRAKVNSTVGTAFKVDAPASGNIGVDTPVIAYCTSQESPTPLDVCAQNCLVIGNRFEVTAGNMTVTIQTGPASFHTTGVKFVKNTYAYPGSLTFTDNSADHCERIGDVTTGGAIPTTLNGVKTTAHYESSGNAPSLTGVNAGIATSSVVGNDVCGVITFTTTGTPPGGFSTLLRVNFTNLAYTGTPVVVLTEQDPGQNYGDAAVFSVSTSGFSLTTNAALGATSTYNIGYIVMGHG